MAIEIIDKKSISLPVLKEELASIKKRDGELSFRGAKTEEYISEFSLIKGKDAQSLYAEIEKMAIPRVRDVHINKIIDLMPRSIPELKVLMQGYSIPVTNDNLKKIVDAVAEHQKK